MPKQGRPVSNIEHQRKQLELGQLRADFDFQNEMREIQLKQKRMQLDRQWKDMQAKGQQQYQGKKTGAAIIK